MGKCRYIRNLNPAKFFTTRIVFGMTWLHLNLYWRHLILYSLLAPFRDDVSYLYVVFQHATVWTELHSNSTIYILPTQLHANT